MELCPDARRPTVLADVLRKGVAMLQLAHVKPTGSVGSLGVSAEALRWFVYPWEVRLSNVGAFP